jgi:lysophospholipase L1-like esterase
MRKYLLITLFSLIFPLGSLEIGLRLFDPWGAYTYYTDLITLSKAFAPDPDRHYILPPGHYTFTHWQATQTTEGRLVPDTQPSDCTIAFLGDSVTFGYAVNDEDTFVNQLARQFPDVHFVNRGLSGYNAAQVAASADDTPSIYFMIHNDSQDVTPQKAPTLSTLNTVFRASTLYYNHWKARGIVSAASPDEYPDWFYAALDSLVARPNILIVAYDNNWLADDIDDRYPITRIPYYGDHHTSYADPHPNPDGHRIIASNLAPIVQTLQVATCSD